MEVKPGSQETSGDHRHCYFRWSMVKGCFLQDYAHGKDNQSLGTVYHPAPNFGLVSHGEDKKGKPSNDAESKMTDWDRMVEHLSQLNASAAENEGYVLIYLARHGQGYHNVAEESFGSHVWEKASSVYDRGLCLHPRFHDAHLTPVGQDQAETLGRYFQNLVTNSHLPLPQAYFVSPLHRSCDTLNRTWARIATMRNVCRDSCVTCANRPRSNFQPVIHELLREHLLPHISNSRCDLQVIHSNFPAYTLYPNAHTPTSETDNLWSESYREQDAQVTHRAILALDAIFDSCFSTQDSTGKPVRIVSLTAHAGLMSGIYRSLGFTADDVPRFPTGIVVPMLLRVQKLSGRRPSVPNTPPAPDGIIQVNEASTPSESTTLPTETIEEIRSRHHRSNSKSAGTPVAEATSPLSPSPYRPWNLTSDVWSYRARPTEVYDPRFGKHHTNRGISSIQGKTLDQVLAEIFDDEHYARVKEELMGGAWR